MNPKGVHVSFASDPLWFIAPSTSQKIKLIAYIYIFFNKCCPDRVKGFRLSHFVIGLLRYIGIYLKGVFSLRMVISKCMQAFRINIMLDFSFSWHVFEFYVLEHAL